MCRTRGQGGGNQTAFLHHLIRNTKHLPRQAGGKHKIHQKRPVFLSQVPAESEIVLATNQTNPIDTSPMEWSDGADFDRFLLLVSLSDELVL